MGSHIENNVEVEIDGEEVLAQVHYFYQHAEFNTGTPAGIELEQVMVDGEEKLFLMTDGEVEQLSLTLLDRVGNYNERF